MKTVSYTHLDVYKRQLHPPYRGAEFCRRLPELIAAVESGQVPDAQRGHYDIHDSMIDWTPQRAAARRHKRWLRPVSYTHLLPAQEFAG